MQRFAPTVLATALGFATLPAAVGGWTSEHIVNPENLPTVKVRIFDGAEGGCWTNIGEARTYAEDKLAGLGYEVRETDEPAHFTFDISITSSRGGGNCYGSAEVSIFCAC